MIRDLRRPSLVLWALALAMFAWAVTPWLLGESGLNMLPAATEAPADETPEEPPVPEEPPGPEQLDLEVALGDVPIETYQVFLARDPFQPIIPPAATGGGEGGGGEGGGGEGGGGEGGSDICSTGSTSATCEGITVTLVDVVADDAGERIIVQVEDTLYEVTEGAIFAGSFQVLSIDAPCATLLYGDDAFTLCQGDRVLK